MKASTVCLLALLVPFLAAGKALADDDVGFRLDDNESQDDTPEIDTETTVDYTEAKTGLKVDGDLRLIFNRYDREGRDGVDLTDDELGFRQRLRLDWGVTETFHIGARLAGSCFSENCDPEFVFETASPAPSGLEPGQFTFDELYLHWFRNERGSLALGRLQTRFVLRGGVFAKSLDRNNSNNTNINWTDGFQATYRASNGWNSSFVLERNTRDGSGSIRRGQLNFEDSEARTTYFTGFENIQNWGPVVQRGFDVSYLPTSLLRDGNPSGASEDYWGFVGRLVARWPQRSEGMRLRAGFEIGFAPETPEADAVNLSDDADGLAWDIVASIIDFRPNHSIGVNYARTGAGWLLSPQFRPNEELIEIHYMWRPEGWPFLEARLRRREDLEQLVGAHQKRKEFDMFIRLTWNFTFKRN